MNYQLDYEEEKYTDLEMEAKFGTKGFRRISKIDFDNVVKKLKSSGFDSINSQEGSYSLKIQPETLDRLSGEYRSSYDIDKFRVEINSLHNIQEYCKTNELDNLININNAVTIMKKNDVYLNELQIKPADFYDFNFRVTLKKESSVSKNGKISQELRENWNKSKKQFRYINRVSFKNPKFPMTVDLSIVRSSTILERGGMIKTYKIDESNVFNNPEIYEIEVEVINREAKEKYRESGESLMKDFEEVIKIVMSGLQKTNYPISYKEQEKVMNEYLQFIFKDEIRKRAYPNNFIGPSSKTLQRRHIAPINPDVIVPNITEPFAFCVTDKADGDRHLLFVNNQGRIYLINTNMNVIFTGAKTTKEEYFNSLIDGELILHNKNGSFINKFASFDIYFINKVDVRALPFMKVPNKDDKIFEKGVRLNLLKNFIKELNPISILNKKSTSSPIKIISKNFYPVFQNSKDSNDNDLQGNSYSIFEACSYIWQRYKDGLFEYNIDGLIFTPTLFGVASNMIGHAGPLKRETWDYSFKWKPSEFNTIDFLVTTKKGSDGKDVVTPIFENGTNMYESVQFNQYKTLILAVGYNEKRHGYINPCQDLLDDKYSNFKESDEDDKVNKPKQFFPSDPYDVEGGLCNVMLEQDANGSLQMFTEERQVFEDGTIVEFKYDISREGIWKWIPLRVRYDKTTEFRNGQNTFGNDYKVANDNWYSIHNPVTEKMITTGKDIPSSYVSTDVYYNSMTGEKMTKGMRDFHNQYVKKILIESVSKKGDTLIDFACGKGGDFPKWIASNLSFVFGMDISKDNIENRLNGCCARYLNFKKEFKTIPRVLFVHGNSSLNVRSGNAMLNDKAISITKSVFGLGSKDVKLGPAVEREYGKGHDGFNISSIQFALHYMFEKTSTFYNFMRNVSECTKLNGYFIGTSYDGKTVFNMLKKKEEGESIDIYENDKKIWQVTKEYNDKNFEDDESCLGYKISVYQDSINQNIPEFLVNYDFLNRIMEDYGFVVLNRQEAKQIGLPEGSGMFIELYNSMIDSIKKNNKLENAYGEAPKMKSYEKNISFLNRYFVYKKVRTVNAEKLTNQFLEKMPDELDFERINTVKSQKDVKEAEITIKPKVKNLNKKIVLQNATEGLEEINPIKTKKVIKVVPITNRQRNFSPTKKIQGKINIRNELATKIWAL